MITIIAIAIDSLARYYSTIDMAIWLYRYMIDIDIDTILSIQFCIQ